MIDGHQGEASSAPQTGALAAEGVTDFAYTRYADLASSRVFITGGGSGIGAYLVHAFAAVGAEVGFVSLSPSGGEALADAIEAQQGKRPWFRACDIRDVTALQAAIAAFRDDFRGVDCLINNAARDDRHTIDALSVEAWDDSLATNLRPHIFTAQSVVGGMRERGHGAIINVGSNSSYLGLSGYPAYVTAKAGIIGLTRSLARELGPDNIRVNALIPGWVVTERQKALWMTPGAVQECIDAQSLKALITGCDVAEAALFLASRASSMITGQALIIDGGRVMG
jgi:galactose dehydrogenase